MSLTDIAIRRAKTRDKPYKLYDELGLILVISPSDSLRLAKTCSIGLRSGL